MQINIKKIIIMLYLFKKNRKTNHVSIKTKKSETNPIQNRFTNLFKFKNVSFYTNINISNQSKNHLNKNNTKIKNSILNIESVRIYYSKFYKRKIAVQKKRNSKTNQKI